MKRVVIHQPDFLPYLGFFHRFLQAELYVALDHAQFVTGTSRSWTHRDKIKTPRGVQWLSLSVHKAPLGTPINAIELAENGWRDRNLYLVRENYRKAPYFAEIFPLLESLYRLPSTRLVDFTLESIALLSRLFDVPVPSSLSSALNPSGTKNQMLIGLLRNVKATHYISGVGARDYLDSAAFSMAGIQVVWQDFHHPVYPQLHGGFIPELSGIDLLFNCGVEQSRAILRSC